MPALSSRNVVCILVSVALACSGTVLSAPGSSSPERMTLAHLGSAVSFGKPALSPDGRFAAVVITRSDFVDDRKVGSLILIDTATAAQRELAPGRLSISSPQWSPTGGQLAWLDAEQDGQPQVYTARMGAVGATAEAVTRADRGVTSFSWSPRGESIAYLTEDAPEERLGEERHNHSFEVRAEHFLARQAAVPSHLWVTAVAGGPPRRLTSGVDSVDEFQWAQGGASILYLTQPQPNRTSELRWVGIDGATTRVVVAQTEAQQVLKLFPTSPDGTLTAYLFDREPWGFRAEGISAQSLPEGGRHDLTGKIDRSFGWEAAWLPGGRGLIAKAGARTTQEMWLLPLKGVARRLDIGPVTQIGSIGTSDGGAVMFEGSQPRHPAELYFKASADARPKRVTHFNDHLATLALGRTATVTWRNGDMEHAGVLIHPPGFVQGHRYPLVLEIHGGPMYHYNEAFNAFHQLLAAQGWVVFCPDYRGGDAQDDAYRRAIVNDIGEGPASDIMAGVEAVKALGIVDESRIAVSGWSYGGLLSAYLSARHPIWRAAVVGAAPTDWQDQYNLADKNVHFGNILGGSPWTDANAERYRQQSPVAIASRSRIPTLILANTGDPRVPVTGSYKWYAALKDNGVPVRFVAYPIDDHWPQDPVQLRDMYRRWVAWIDEHFRGDAVAPAR